MAGLALIVELLAKPGCDLGVDLAGIDGPVVTGIDREDELELTDVGRYRRRHVRVLQFAGERCAVVSRGPVHLAERGCGCSLHLEICEGRAPVGSELGGHAPLDESPAHRRCSRLEGAERLGILVRKAAGDRREQLRDLHQRPLEAAERAPELGGVPLPIRGQAEIALPRHARGDSAHGGSDPRVTAHTPAQPVALPIRHVYACSLKGLSPRRTVIWVPVMPRGQHSRFLPSGNGTALNGLGVARAVPPGQA